MIPRPPRLPREHGAWAMLFVPLVVGFLAAGRATPAALVIVPATVLLFLARFAAIPGGTRLKSGGPGRRARLERWRLAWTAVYGGASAAGLATAVALADAEHRAAAIGVAVVTGALGLSNAGLVLAGRGRSAAAEALAMAGVAATATLIVVLAGGGLGPRALGAGALCLAYFLSTLASVRAFRACRAGAASGAVRAAPVAADVALGAALVLQWRAGAMPGELLFAFAPVVLRTLAGLVRPPATLRQAGWREAVVSLLLVAAVSVGVQESSRPALGAVVLGTFAGNVPFGAWRVRCRKLSPAWFMAVHAGVPLVVALRFATGLGFRPSSVPAVVAAYFLGQALGARLRRPH